MRQSLSFRVLSPLIFAAAIAACGGGGVEPIEGPLNLDIVAGQDQIGVAGTPRLSDPVVGQLVRVRTADGRWRFKFDLVKTAYAQSTTVKGSPVVGAVVCSETVAGNFKPFSVCTNTDSAGKATFFYETGTKAGAQRAEVRGLNAQGQPAVFDTVRATVEPGPADGNRVFNYGAVRNSPTLSCCIVNSGQPHTVSDSSVADAYVNLLPFRIVGDSLISLADTTTGSVGARTIDFPRWWERPETANNDAARLAYDRTGVLRVLSNGGAHVANLRYVIEDGNGIGWIVKGLNLTP